MEAIQDACEGSWAINGDFNLILNEADKNNGRINMAEPQEEVQAHGDHALWNSKTFTYTRSMLHLEQQVGTPYARQVR